MNWRTTTIGKVCEVIAGQSPESIFYNKESNGVAFYQGKKDFGDKFIESPTVWTTQVTKIAEPGDILMSVRAPVGPVNITNEKICIGRGLAAIRAKEGINRDFLFYFLRKIENELTGSSGAVFNSINKAQISSINIPLPPLSTQHKIVAKLDAIFAEIDKATAAAEANAKNAEALFQSYLREVFENCGEGYKEFQLGDICKIIGGGTPSKTNPKFYEGNILWATVRDMTEDVIKDTDFKINDEAVSQSSTNIIPKNNVIIATRVGLGKVCIIENDTAINQDLRGVIPIEPNLIEVMYLFYWFKSIAKVIIDAGRGATVHGVTLPFIKALKIKVPDIYKQRTIISKVQDIQSNINVFNSATNKKINELQLLKQSILQKAFNGELIWE